MTTGKTPMDEWKTIPWKHVERSVFKLQKRIYQASLQNDRKKVHSIQRLLMKSRSGRMLAVRRVTQDNQGKKTAGIDGIKSLTPNQRLNLSKNPKGRWESKSRPSRRDTQTRLDDGDASFGHPRNRRSSRADGGTTGD